MPFHLVPPRDRKLFRLVKKAETLSLVKGRSLYAAGDPAKDVYLVRSGFVRLVLPGMERARPERTVAVALPWEMFGDEALTEGHRRYGAVAGSTCSVNALPKGAVLAGLKTARSSLDAYLEGQERELHRLRHAQGGSHGPTAAQRLAEVLIEMGARCGEPSGRGTVLSEKLTHQVLADLSGAHRATVTTLLNDWLYEGILGATPDNRLALKRPGDLWILAGYHPPTELPAR
ncbi:MAG: Crp/Fnr family transcriptional regulator [Gemmatimonadetes bacterium]|nr:Crp/Fnr family transcriptional regulator [Gemmatimonadota bacterium]MDA1104634.1 Crp/Fnr family transcriptional regulator [Gemmatimonadota bacterium]